MKKVLSLVVVFATLVAFTSCKKANGPEVVAENYLKAIASMDYTKAKTMVTEESVATIEMMESLAGMSGEAAGVDITVKDMKCDVKENDAVCTCTVVKGEEEESETINLKNVDGKWLVHQPKEAPDDDLFDFDEEEEEIVEAEIEEVVEDVIE